MRCSKSLGEREVTSYFLEVDLVLTLSHKNAGELHTLFISIHNKLYFAVYYISTEKYKSC